MRLLWFRRSICCRLTASYCPSVKFGTLHKNQHFPHLIDDTMAQKGRESPMIDIDGGIMDGGGQVVRNSVAFAALFGKSVHIFNIRTKDPNPSKRGLKAQHLTGVNLVSQLCNARISGAHIDSLEIEMHPDGLNGGVYTADTGTAGSTMLLMQVSLPCLLFANSESRVTLKGGTNAEMAPQIDYTQLIFGPIASRMGVNFEMNIKRRGYFPKGGGVVELTTQPVLHLEPIDLTERGNAVAVRGRAFVAGAVPGDQLRAMVTAATQALKRRFSGIPIEIDSVVEPPNAAVGSGSGIVLYVETSTGCRIGGSALGSKKTERNLSVVGVQAAEEVMSNWDHGGCVDEHMQDQLLIFMALAKGTSRVRTGPISTHSQVAIHFAQILSPAVFTVSDAPGSATSKIVTCVGCGWQNSQLS